VEFFACFREEDIASHWAGRPPPWLAVDSLCQAVRMRWRWSGDGQEGSTLPAKMAAVR
jgi:hypothetical protein